VTSTAWHDRPQTFTRRHTLLAAIGISPSWVRMAAASSYVTKPLDHTASFATLSLPWCSHNSNCSSREKILWSAPSYLLVHLALTGRTPGSGTGRRASCPEITACAACSPRCLRSFNTTFFDLCQVGVRGGVWHKKDREAGVVPHTSIDTQANWTKSGWHGWVYGWKSHLECTCAAVWISLAVELDSRQPS